MTSGANTKSKELKADVVVVGGGAAGTVAAVAAAERGVDVILLEKRHSPGGNAVFAGGMFVVEEQADNPQAAQALRDDYFKKAMSYAHWKINPRLVRALLEKSGDTVPWLEEKGMRFERRQMGPAGISLPFYVGPEKMTGAGLVKAMVRRGQELGMRILNDTGARRLRVDEAGKICGVIAQGKDGEVNVATKSVVLATGGFAGNKELMNRYFPYCHYEDMHVRGLPHQGDGTVMALEIGAASDSQAVLEMDGPFFPPVASFFPRVSMNRHSIWLNRRGERYTDESAPNMFESTNSLFRQPGRISYTIFDENIKQIILNTPAGPMGGGTDWAGTVDADIRRNAEKGEIGIANSWDGIASFMGVKPEALRATIDEYNAACDAGYDALFLKEPAALVKLGTPPYYAIRCRLSLLVTHGGIKINHRTEVVNDRDDPIPGLYAAGVEVTGREAGTYNSALPGHSLGFSVHSGRIAGENAAGYVRGK